MGGMEEKQLLLRAEIDEEEWEKTPPSVRRAFLRVLKELFVLRFCGGALVLALTVR
jgi:hypothetical protein